MTPPDPTSPAAARHAVHDLGGARRRRPGPRFAVVGVLAVCLVAAGIAVARWERSSAERAVSVQGLATPAHLVFDRDANVFTLDVRDAPVAERSAQMVAGLLNQVATGGPDAVTPGTAGLTTAAAFYAVEDDAPRVDVAFHDCTARGAAPEGLLDGRGVFVDVPIPADARAARAGGGFVVWSPSSDQMWQFSGMRSTGEGAWAACDGARLDDVSTQPGYFGEESTLPGSGLAAVGAMVQVEEARSQTIRHSVGLSLPAMASWPTHWFPAQGTDGFDPSADAIPAGARLRLDPQVDVYDLTLTPLARAVALAAQRYGFVVVGSAPGVSVNVESGAAASVRFGEDPWPALLGNVAPNQQLAGFPWDKLQVIDPEWSQSAD